VTAGPHLGDGRAQRLVDGELSAAERARCTAHLASCEDCRLAVESYRALAAALDGLAAPEPDADFTAAVLRRIEAVDRVEARERRAGTAIAGASTALALLATAAAGAPAWAPAVSAWAGALVDGLRAAAVGADVAGPILHAFRLELLLAGGVAAAPLLLALRLLAVRAPPTSAG
jgi:anti-sigma factor RsiW